MTLKLHLRCNGFEECSQLVEEIIHAKGVNTSLIKYSVEGNGITVWIYGSKSEAYATKKALMNAYRRWRELHTSGGGRISVRLSTLNKELGRPVPADAFIEVLKLMGIPVVKEGDRLIIHGAAPQEILSTAQDLSDRLTHISKAMPKMSRAAKSLVIAYSFFTREDPVESAKWLEESGVLVKEGVRISVEGEWRNLLRKLVGEKEGEN